MTLFYAEKCYRLLSEHKASAGADQFLICSTIVLVGTGTDRISLLLILLLLLLLLFLD